MALTVDDLKRMPFKYKVLIVCGLLALVAYFYYFSVFAAILDSRTQLRERLETLDQQIAIKRVAARQIEKHKRDIAKLRKDLQEAMNRLPEQKEIPGLLTSVTQAGIQKGLEFKLFKPDKPIEQDFYAEIPVKIIVLGGYHDLARFFESVARLPRIMNVRNLAIKKEKAKQNTGRLEASFTIKTYMFVEKKNEGKKKKTAKKK